MGMHYEEGRETGGYIEKREGFYDIHRGFQRANAGNTTDIFEKRDLDVFLFKERSFEKYSE